MPQVIKNAVSIRPITCLLETIRKNTLSGIGAALVLGLSGLLQPALAEDTDTPGNGTWEVKTTISSERSDTTREITAPEIEVNYGLSETTQLTAVLPWITVKETGESSKSGIGTGVVGFKWRFIDHEKEGYTMSLFPQYAWNWVHASEIRGIVSPTKEFFLPIQGGLFIGETKLFLEAGRNFIKNKPDEWSIGLSLKHPCGAIAQCFIAAEQSLPQDVHQTKVGLGIKWDLNDAMTLNTGVGRAFGRHTPDQLRLRVQVGVEIVFEK